VKSTTDPDRSGPTQLRRPCYIVAAVHAELLRSDLPRTATVRAADDTILHVGVLARERFIAP
jgi:hypothetical protein